jgi:hypothetical protein
MSKPFILFVAFIIFSECILAQANNYPTKKLEAICIVGSSVGNRYEERTEEIAVFLESNNVKVHRFYDGNNNWDRIKKAAENCTFFIYSGHGTYLGLDGGFGGLVVEDFISAQQIVNELKFKKDAIVVYQSACGSAGSSAGDEGDIGLETAEERVIETATPFLLAGAKAYHANNYYGGALDFVKNILEGNTVNESFINTSEAWNRIEKNERLIDKRLPSLYHVGITSDKDYNKSKDKRKSYSIAYVGIPSFKLSELNLLSKK